MGLKIEKDDIAMQDVLKAFAVLEIPTELLKEDAYLKRDLQMDSVEIVQLTMELKKSLGIVIKMGSQDMTIGALCQWVEELKRRN